MARRLDAEGRNRDAQKLQLSHRKQLEAERYSFPGTVATYCVAPCTDPMLPGLNPSQSCMYKDDHIF